MDDDSNVTFLNFQDHGEANQSKNTLLIIYKISEMVWNSVIPEPGHPKDNFNNSPYRLIPQKKSKKLLFEYKSSLFGGYDHYYVNVFNYRHYQQRGLFSGN